MRTSMIAFAAVALAAAASPALAQDAPTSDLTINGGATVVSDYRFRGLSQTDKRFAIQGTFSVSSASTGLYGTVWGSSIDDYVAAGGDAELDLIVGWKKAFGGATIDIGLLYYYYPGSSELVPNVNSDFAEPYASISGTVGPLTAKVTANYAWKQRALSYGVNDKEDNLYVAGDLSTAIPNTGLTVSGHFGRNFNRSYLTGGAHGYNDWNVGVSYAYKNFTFGASYVDTNRSDYYLSDNGRRIGKAGAVGSVGVSF